MAAQRQQTVQIVKNHTLDMAKKMRTEWEAPEQWFIEGWLLATQLLMSDKNDRELADYAKSEPGDEKINRP